MIKKYSNLSFIYAVLAMVFGVFYREFTKFSGFTGITSLSVIHTHYFLLGMFFFLIMVLLEKNFPFSQEKSMDKLIISYNIGLNITTLGLFLRGLVQVKEIQLSKGLDASLSGLSGLGHIIIGLSMLMILSKFKKQLGKE